MPPLRISVPVALIVPPFSSMIIGCEAVMAAGVFSVPLFFSVMLLLASPSEPYCAPSLLARYVAVRVPLLITVPPLYLLMLLILTSPLPSTKSVPSPSMAPSPVIEYVLVSFLKTMFPGVTFSATVIEVFTALSSNVTSSPVTNFLSEEEKFSEFIRSQMPSVAPVHTTSSLPRPSYTLSVILPFAYANSYFFPVRPSIVTSERLPVNSLASARVYVPALGCEVNTNTGALYSGPLVQSFFSMLILSATRRSLSFPLTSNTRRAPKPSSIVEAVIVPTLFFPPGRISEP